MIDIDENRWYIHSTIIQILLLFLPLLVQSFFSPAWADVYSYVDKNGVVHFTNTPPTIRYKKIFSTKKKKAPIVRLKKRKPLVPYNYKKIIESKSQKYNLDPSLVSAVIKAESNWNPDAVSPKGAKGLMQLMPSTAFDLDVEDPFNPEENIEGGTKYLKRLIKLFDGDIRLALAAYNAGPGAVLEYGGIPPFKETINYVKKVSAYYDKDIPIPKYKKGKTKYRTRNAQKFYTFIDRHGTLVFTNVPLNYTSSRGYKKR